MILDEITHIINRTLRLRHHPGKHIPDVPHVLPHIQRHVYTGVLCPLRKASGITEQNLIRTNLYEHRRKSMQVSVYG